MTGKSLKEISKYCFLLKDELILEELNQIIKGFELIVTVFNNGKYILKFLNSNNNTICLTIDIDSIHLTKTQDESYLNISINNQFLKQTSIEKREKGLIITETRKIFERTKKYGDISILTDLIEDRYVFSDNNFDSLIKQENGKELSFDVLFKKIKNAELCFSLSDCCDLYTNFSAHMANVYEKHKKNSDLNATTTKLFINGQNLCDLFNIADGPDKIYRIYDLYRGIINKMNEQDILSINSGTLSDNAFDYKRFIGITDKEEKIVGKPKKTVASEYIDYLTNFFNEHLGYNGDIVFERDSILAAINHRMSATELIKKNIERKLGIPYCEFELLDLDEQHKIIETVTGKKLKPDYRQRIDGIPLDKKHILTREYADKRLTEIIEDKPKCILKRLFRK